jgi:hypothetical protein
MKTTPEVVAKIHAFAERRLSLEEFEAWVSAPWSAEDLEEARSLIAWHMRRYPRPIERLRHAREVYARWARTMPEPPRRAEPIDDGMVTLELE